MRRFLFLSIFCLASLIRAQAQNNALNFDGVDDYVAIPSVATNLKTFTIEMWVKPTTINASGIVALLNTNSWDTTNGGSVHFQVESGKLIISVCGITTGWPSSNTWLVMKAWQHLAVTYDQPNNTVKFYVNGMLVSTVNKPLPVAKVDVACIGSWTGTDRFFNGSIDEVRVWNTVRTAGEIAENLWGSLPAPETAAGLIAYYPFDQGAAGVGNATTTTLADKSGKHLDGALKNFSLGNFSNWCERAAGDNALHFDGADDYVDLGASTAVDFSNGFSFTAMVKWDAFKSWSRIFDFGNGENSDNIILANIGTTRQLDFSVRRGSTEKYFYSNTSFNTNQWYNVVVTISAIGNVKLYVNGVLDNSVTGFHLPLSLVRNRQYIGRSNWAADSYFSGMVDNLSIWNRELSAAEVAAGANNLTGGESGLVYLYKFNQGEAGGANNTMTTLPDASALRQNGTLINFGLTGKLSNWITGFPQPTIVKSNMIPNPGAENGGGADLRSLGWNCTGNPLYQYNTIVTPHSGSWVMAVYSGNSVNTTRDSYRDFDVSDLTAGIDNGEYTASLTGWLVMTGQAGGVTKLQLDMLDANGSPLYDLYGNPVVCSFSRSMSANTWQQVSINEAIAKGTRKLRVWLYGSVTNGAAAFDDLSLTIKSTANKAPTVSAIAPQITNSGETLGPISFTVADDLSDALDLSTTATSDNTTLVSNSNIVLGGSDANRTIQIKSTAGQSGSANITIAVSDGTNTTRSTFALTVNPSHPMGTNLVVNPNGGSVSGWNGETSRFILTGGKFTVGSVTGTVENPIKTLMYQDINLSKFKALIDAGFIQFTGSSTLAGGGECTFQGLDAYGNLLWTKSSGTIDANTKTVRITIGGLQGASITAVNFTILNTGFPKCTAIADQTLMAGDNSGSLPFVIGYTGAGSITATSSNTSLIPNGRLEISGVNYQRTIKVTSLGNTNGTSTITVLADGVTAKTFSVSVFDVPGVPTNVSASAGKESAVVSFSNPVSNGGKPITLFTVTSSPEGKTATGSTSPIRVPGLTVGKPYTFTVTATNATGTGAPSAVSNSVVPTALITIGSFSPIKGEVGSTVTINGTNFNAVASNNVVYFGSTRATVSSATPTTLTVTVPVGASTHPISVTDITTNITASSSMFFNPTFKGCATPTFTPQQEVAKLVSSTGSSVVDVDGDGKPDVVVANNILKNIAVLMNASSLGTTAFSAPATIPVESNPRNVVMKDVDGDGKPDMISTNETANSVSVMLNISTPGKSAFAAAVNFAVGTSPNGLVICDIDCDGKPDIAVTNENSNTISILRNTCLANSCSFAPALDFATQASPCKIASGDIDGDGKPDLVVTNWDSHSISIFRNTSTEGAINFDAAIHTFIGQYPSDVAICDFDGNGKADVAVSLRGNKRVAVLPNSSTPGDIRFNANMLLDMAGSPECIAIGDFDGNGLPDIAAGSSTSADVTLFYNTSRIGEMSFPRTATLAGETQQTSILANDVDGDGKCDIVSNSYSGKVSVFRNTTELATLSINTTSFPIDYSDVAEHYAYITSNTIWKGTSNQDWLTIRPTNQTQGNSALYFSATENTNLSARMATITVSIFGLPNQTITVTQSAAPEIVVAAVVNAENSGTISGAGRYGKGSAVSLTATPMTGFSFVNWTENGTEVSTASTYTFVATTNRALVANFKLATGVGEVTGATALSVYPNPVKNQLTIEVKDNSRALSFELLNIGGQVVYRGTVVDKAIIPTGNFMPGIYILRLEIDGRFEFKRIVKE